jgi:hypothetical protein
VACILRPSRWRGSSIARSAGRELFARASGGVRTSCRSHDSFGEAYVDSERYDLAVVNYRRSLALNPKNAGAFEVLQKVAAMLSGPHWYAHTIPC